MINAFTIDLEEWFCSHNLQAVVRPNDWEQLPPRASVVTHRLLDLLDKHQVKATFFVLGWLADRYPELVQQVQAAGHEIASHGYAHLLTGQHTKDSFGADLKKANRAIEACTGARPAKFRAPAFSITQKTLWATDILLDNAFEVDSSVFPLSWHPEYGIPEAKLEPFYHPNGLLEIPMSVLDVFGKRLPVSGGAYFRLLPYPVYAKLIRQLHKQGRPLVFYLHPWEMDPQMPILPGLSASARFRHYTNLNTVARKLEKLLTDFEFTTLEDVFPKEVKRAASFQGYVSQYIDKQ
jgi:polysaccharide deacetylase family protein (PEP-CTERM system associated)